MTHEQLEAIRKRAEKATEGPWNYYFTHGISVKSESKEILDDEVGVIRYTDAEFIAHAREDIPALLAEVERLKAQLSEAESLLSEAHDMLDNVHCYDTELYGEITKYFYGEEDA